MRSTVRLSTMALMVSMSLSSCTCHKDLPPPPVPTPPAFKAREGGFESKPLSKRTTGAAVTPTPQGSPAAAEPTPELPKDFPKDVPVYKDASVDQVQDLPNNAHNVIFRTAGTVSEVNRFYHDQLTKAGWTATQQFERNNHAFMTYKKGNLIANVTIAEDSRTPGKQVIAVMYEEEQPLPFEEF